MHGGMIDRCMPSLKRSRVDPPLDSGSGATSGGDERDGSHSPTEMLFDAASALAMLAGDRAGAAPTPPCSSAATDPDRAPPPAPKKRRAVLTPSPLRLPNAGTGDTALLHRPRCLPQRSPHQNTEQPIAVPPWPAASPPVAPAAARRVELTPEPSPSLGPGPTPVARPTARVDGVDGGGRPGAALTGLCLITFQTRSRDTSRQLQQDARMANRRYIPPARGIHQKIDGRTSPPPTPAAMLSEDNFAAVRIGDTVEVRFNPVTPFADICRGAELPANAQAALRFETTVPAHDGDAGSSAAVRRIEFEILYYSFTEGIVCLRCQGKQHACCCTYHNDLLEINRDWKTKRDPSRRLGLRQVGDGSVSIALRIPRARRPLSKDESQRGCAKRTNNWNSKLKLIHPKDPKAVVFRVVEYSRAADAPADAPWAVLTRSQCFARLIAKNGGQLRAGKKKQGLSAAVPLSNALQAPIRAAAPTAVATGPAVLAAPAAVFAPGYAYAYNGDPTMLPIIPHPSMTHPRTTHPSIDLHSHPHQYAHPSIDLHSHPHQYAHMVATNMRVVAQLPH